MLYTSLILSGLLLLLVNHTTRKLREPGPTIVVWALVIGFGPAFMMLILPALMLQALLLIVVAAVWRWLPKTRRAFLPLSCCATLAAYGVVGWSVYRQQAEQREQFPYLSMEERLPTRKVVPAAPSLAAAAAKRLEHFEAMIEHRDPATSSERARIDYLRQLHEEAVETFINQPGFGVARTSGVSGWVLKEGLREGPPLPQPAPRNTSVWSAGALQVSAKGVDGESNDDLRWMHLYGVLDFVHPKGFGFIKDRRHVAGFQSHQFSEQPKPGRRWALKTLDLVGLVVHDKPVAYVSANLPRMDELRRAPTRPLDAFETAGLKSLRGGEDLFVRDTPDGHRRVLGAVRSGKHCLSCHEGQRGELLGAFSYTLAPVAEAAGN
jgi:hypothetical protein